MSTRRIAVLAAALALVAGACARTIPVDGAPPDSQRREEDMRPRTATVTVRNLSTREMTMYAVRGGQRVRLGVARALSDTDLRIPADLIAGSPSLRFLGDPIGGSRRQVDQSIVVSPGDRVSITIPPG